MLPPDMRKAPVDATAKMPPVWPAQPTTSHAAPARTDTLEYSPTRWTWAAKFP